MRCPSCGHADDKVVDSRVIDGGETIRRRRECEKCSRRFNTYERLEEILPMIVKRDGRREPFSRAKLLRGIRTACRKRPVSSEAVETMVESVERFLISGGDKELPSAIIGDLVMKGLEPLDTVAYIRFASVYHSFDNTEAFARLLESLKGGSDSNANSD